MLFLVYFSIACLFAAWWGFAPAKKALYLTTSGERVSSSLSLGEGDPAG